MNTEIIYYLAAPYSHEDPAVKEQRFRGANRAAAKIIRDGHFVYSPISHCHPLSIDASLPGDWDFWQRYCTVSLRWCNRVMVLKLDGWDKSKGVQAEIDIAKEMGLTIEYMEPV